MLLPTPHQNLAAAVAEHDDRRVNTTSYTDAQWLAIQRLCVAFGLDVARCKGIALVAGQPLLAVVAQSEIQRSPNGRATVRHLAVVEAT